MTPGLRSRVERLEASVRPQPAPVEAVYRVLTEEEMAVVMPVLSAAGALATVNESDEPEEYEVAIEETA